jgi:hypothetical protein
LPGRPHPGADERSIVEKSAQRPCVLPGRGNHRFMPLSRQGLDTRIRKDPGKCVGHKQAARALGPDLQHDRHPKLAKPVMLEPVCAQGPEIAERRLGVGDDRLSKLRLAQAIKLLVGQHFPEEPSGKAVPITPPSEGFQLQQGFRAQIVRPGRFIKDQLRVISGTRAAAARATCAP